MLAYIKPIKSLFGQRRYVNLYPGSRTDRKLPLGWRGTNVNDLKTGRDDTVLMVKIGEISEDDIRLHLEAEEGNARLSSSQREGGSG